jgi:hypothetical protein
MNSSRSIGTCGPQKLDQTYRLPELRERTPPLWAPTGGYQNPCRTFAEVSYALLCTVMQFATDVTAKKQPKFKNLGADYKPGGRWALYANRSIATRAQHYCEATFVRDGKLARVNHDVSQHRQTAPVDRRPGVYENVAALFCVPLHCTAFDCDGEVARTP